MKAAWRFVEIVIALSLFVLLKLVFGLATFFSKK